MNEESSSRSPDQSSSQSEENRPVRESTWHTPAKGKDDPGSVFHTPLQHEASQSNTEKSKELSPHVIDLVETLKFIESSEDTQIKSQDPTPPKSPSSQKSQPPEAPPSIQTDVVTQQSVESRYGTPNSLYVSMDADNDSPSQALSAYGTCREAGTNELVDSSFTIGVVDMPRDPDVGCEVDAFIQTPSQTPSASPSAQHRAIVTNVNTLLNSDASLNREVSRQREPSAQSGQSASSPRSLRSSNSSLSISKIPTPIKTKGQSISRENSASRIPRKTLSNPPTPSRRPAASASNSPKDTRSTGVRSHVFDLVESLKDASVPKNSKFELKGASSQPPDHDSGKAEGPLRRNVRITKASPSTSMWKRNTVAGGRTQSMSSTSSWANDSEPSVGSRGSQQASQPLKSSSYAHNLQKMRIAGRKARERTMPKSSTTMKHAQSFDHTKASKTLPHTRSAPPRESTWNPTRSAMNSPNLKTLSRKPSSRNTSDVTLKKKSQDSDTAFLMSSERPTHRARGNSVTSTSSWRTGSMTNRKHPVKAVQDTAFNLESPSAQELRSQLHVLQERFNRIISKKPQSGSSNMETSNPVNSKGASSSQPANRRVFAEPEKNITFRRKGSRPEVRTKPGEFLFSSRIGKSSQSTTKGSERNLGNRSESLRTKSSSDVLHSTGARDSSTDKSYRQQRNEAASRSLLSARKASSSASLFASGERRTPARRMFNSRTDFRSKSMLVQSLHESSPEVGKRLTTSRNIDNDGIHSRRTASALNKRSESFKSQSQPTSPQLYSRKHSQTSSHKPSRTAFSRGML